MVRFGGYWVVMTRVICHVFSGHACVYSVPWSETIITFFLMTSSFQMQCNGTNSLWKYWCFSYALYFSDIQRHSVTLCTQESKLKHFSLWAKWKVLYCKMTLAHSCHIKWLLVCTNSRNVPRVAWGQREERCVPDKKWTLSLDGKWCHKGTHRQVIQVNRFTDMKEWC